jgi:hypothetical protein
MVTQCHHIYNVIAGVGGKLVSQVMWILLATNISFRLDYNPP